MNSRTVSLLRLSNLEPRESSRLAMVSLPVPRHGRLPAGFAGFPTQSQDIAWWPGSQVSRRRLLFGLSDEAWPREVRLGRPSPSPGRLPAVDASIRIVKQDLTGLLPYQTGELVLRWKNRSFGLRLGIRWKREWHWWQWLRLEQLWDGPLVKAIRVGGYIEVDRATERDFRDPRTWLGGPRLHRHDWLFAEVFALCFANGVVQITARHINNHRFDEGRELQDLYPVLGFVPDATVRCRDVWDGRQTRFQFGSATVNLDDAAPLASPEHPGRLHAERDVLVFQPYEGVAVAGHKTRRGDEMQHRVAAKDRRMPKGLARTVRFSVALGATAPEVTRLVVPEWWYALCGDRWPEPVLPVRDESDRRIDRTYEVNAHDQRGRFDEGVFGPHWEGESVYAAFQYAYRTGQPEHHRRAVRDSYHLADIAFDHSTETMRMSGLPFDGSTAPPLFRTAGMTFGYLETGDPYLLECSEAAANHWYWIDRQNWPRYGYGRDGASIRSLIFLWDYTGNENYRRMAREAIGRLIQCQNPDGSWVDQGGTTGLHALGQVAIKPWMANLATDPILDYLQRVPDDAELWSAVERTGRFMLRSFWKGKNFDYWPYQLSWGGGKYDPWIHRREPDSGGNLPTRRNFAHGHKARLLSILTRRTGQAKYHDTWLRFYRRHWANVEPRPDYNVLCKTLQYLPFAQAHFCHARWENGIVEIAPLPAIIRREWTATILTPAGNLTLQLRRQGRRWRIVGRSGADVAVRIVSVAFRKRGRF